MALHDEHPQYGFDGHKGYSTPEHLAALREHGACRHHRRSFAPVRDAIDRLFLALRVGVAHKLIYITSRDNALLVRLRKLARHPGEYRKIGQVLLEGEHRSE